MIHKNLFETLEKEELPRNQAKAIPFVVRKLHEVSDLATKAAITKVKRDISDVRKEISEVRKNLSVDIQ